MFDMTADEFAERLKEQLRGELPTTMLRLSDAKVLLARVGMDIQPVTLRQYAEGKEPRMNAVKHNNAWVVGVQELIRWALVYKAEPKRGARR